MPFFLYVLVFLGLPLYVVFHGALTNGGHFTFANFSSTLGSSGYRASFRNSVVLALWTSVAGAVFGTWLAAAVLAGKPNGLLRRIVSSASAVLAYFGGVPLAFLFIATLGIQGALTELLKNIGIVNLTADGFTISSMFGVGLAYVYFQVPLMVILITPALEGLRPQWREAAQSLGATRFAYLRHVAVPVLAPAFIGGTLLLFGNAFAAYATALALVGSTINIVPARIDDAINGNVIVSGSGTGLALGVEMIAVVAVVMVVYALVQRRARRWLQ